MAGKHLFLVVPDYDGSSSTTDGPPLSYMVLGSTTTTLGIAASILDGTGDTWPGGDLLAVAGVDDTAGFFMDDSATNNEVDRNQDTAGTTYKRWDGATTTASTTADLDAELRTRGGYRDHTDGNRISTTRGDRIDFVQGNYKRVIMGRVTNSTAGIIGKSTWESSGGHNHDSTSTPGEVTSIAWVTGTYGDTWQVIERTENGNTIERFSGKKVEEYYGPFKVEVTGYHATQDAAFPNRTVAATLTSDSFPTIDEKTYATTITNTTTLDHSLERTTVITSKTDEEETRFLTGKTGSSSQRVATFKEHLVTSSLWQQEFFVVKFEHATGGFTSSTSGNSVSLSIKVLGLELGIGASTSLTLGNFAFGAELSGESSIFLGLAASGTIGGTMEVDLSENEVKMNNEKIEGGLTSENFLKCCKLMVVEKDTAASDIHL